MTQKLELFKGANSTQKVNPILAELSAAPVRYPAHKMSQSITILDSANRSI